MYSVSHRFLKDAVLEGSELLPPKHHPWLPLRLRSSRKGRLAKVPGATWARPRHLVMLTVSWVSGKARKLKNLGPKPTTKKMQRNKIY